MNFFERFTKRPMMPVGTERSSGGVVVPNSETSNDEKIIFTDGLEKNHQPSEKNVNISETEAIILRSAGTKIETIQESEEMQAAQKENEQGIVMDETTNIFGKINEEIMKLSEECIDINEKIKALAIQAEDLPRKGQAKKVDSAKKKIAALSSQSDVLLEQEGQLVDANEEELIQLDDVAKQNIQLANDGNGELNRLMDASLIARKKERRDAFQGVAAGLESLFEEAENIMKSFEKTEESSPQKSPQKEEKNVSKKMSPEIGNLAGSNGNLGMLEEAKKWAIPAETTVPVGIGTHVEEPTSSEVSTEFLMVLDGLRTKVMNLIDTIQTPADYANFRRGMLIKPSTEKSQSDKRYFFDLNDIKDQMRRTITDEELIQIKTLTKELEHMTREKFRTLKEADLTLQFDREQAKIVAAENEEVLDELVKTWTQKPNVIFVWDGDILDNLTEKERERVVTDYERCSNDLSNNLQKKREELQKPMREMMDQLVNTIREKERVAKEKLSDVPANDENKQIYDDYESYLNRLRQAAERAFDKRKVEKLQSILGKVAEAECRLKESKKEQPAGQEEKTYEEFYQKLGRDALEISFEEDRLKSALAAGLQDIQKKIAGINIVEFVHENKEDLVQAFSQSIMIRLNQLSFTQKEKELFSRTFIEKYFEERIK